MTLDEFWPQCLGRLKSQITPQQFRQWIAPLTVGEEDGSWIVYSPSLFASQLVNRQYGSIIKEACQSLAPQAAIVFKVGSGRHFEPFEAAPSNTDSNAIDSQSVQNLADTSPSISAKEDNPTSAHQSEGKAARSSGKINPLDIIRRHQNTHSNKSNEIGNQAENRPSETNVAQNTRKTSKRTHQQRQSTLSPDYTFENLVEGKGNRLAVQAALAIAESPAKKYNPFFVYGSTGLGKTHLVQAIGNEIIKNNPEARVGYIHANDYIQSLMKAVRDKDFDRFRAYYNAFDLLIIDDIQFIKHKERTMEEFFHLYNSYHDNSKQIVLTCDVVPQNLNGMDDRLKSRFSWGLTLEIEPPELEMRAAILQQWAEAEGLVLDDISAIQIAKLCRTNVRELMGAFNRVKATSQFQNAPIDEELINEALKDLVADANKVITVELIIQETAKYYHIKNSDILSKKRTRNIARPRQIAMALTKELTNLSLPSIGEAFGGKDHSTVLHAVKAVNKLRGEDPEIGQDYDKLLVIIKN